MKTKSQIKKEIAKLKLDLRLIEINHGYDSPERAEAAKVYIELQMELGKIELRELGIEPVA
jgi:hypothetical protein